MSLRLTERVTLTDRYVRSLPFAEHGHQEIVRDAALPGFFVLVGETVKTFTVQYDVKDALGKRKTIRKTIGRCDTMTVAEARREAATMMAQKTVAEKRTDVTLRQAWESYRTYLEREGRSPNTIHGGEDAVNRVLADWCDVPLRRLAENPAMVEARYNELLGPDRTHKAIGHNVFATVRAVYNKAMRTDPALRALGNPVAFKLVRPKKRTDCALSAAELCDWYHEVCKIDNPIRRYFMLALLLSGSRVTALAEAKWADIDLPNRVWHVLKPKGGEGKAYDVPLSRRLMWLLAKCRKAGQMESYGSPWVFPSAKGKTGHVVEFQEKKQPDLPCGHSMRHTFYSIAMNDLEVYVPTLNALVNHANKGLIDTYAKPDPAKLRRVQEAMSNFIWKALLDPCSRR